jgi:hypothetical protein
LAASSKRILLLVLDNNWAHVNPHGPPPTII